MELRKFSNTTVALIVLMFFSAQHALAKVDLAAQLMRAKILRPDQSISADVHAHDVTISTYVNKDSDEDKDSVCKSEALLIAKKVFALLPLVTQVRVWFHDYTGADYREVVVSLDDLCAFEVGWITHEQLMERIKIKLGHSLQGSEVYAENLKSKQPRGIKVGTGLSFYYPSGWLALPTSSGNTLAVVTSRADLGGPDIRLTLSQPIEAVTDPGDKTRIRIGYGGTYVGLEVVSKCVDANGERCIDRHVYFNDGQYHYKIGIICPAEEDPKISKDFNFVLSTLHW